MTDFSVRRLSVGAGTLVSAAAVVGAVAVVLPPAAQPAAGSPAAHHLTTITANAPLPEAEYAVGWKRLPSIARGPRQEHGTAALDGRVYVVGGIVPTPDGRVETTGRVEVYDPATRAWTDAAPLPVPMNHPNLATVGGRLLVLGGLSGGASWQAIGDSFAYDPAADRWSRLGDVPPAMRRGSAATGVHGDTVYLAGGMLTLTPGPGGLQDTVATVSAYHVPTGRWATLTSLPQARDHAGGAVAGGTFYVLGGRDRGQLNVRDEVYALNLRSGRWSERSPMPTPRGGLATAAVGDRIYTFGGEGNPAPGSDHIFRETEVYDARTDRWKKLAPMPLPRHGTAAVAIDGTIYIPGGGNQAGGAPVDVVDAYRPR